MRNTVFRLLFGVIVFFLTVIGLEAFGTQGGSDTTREMAMASLPATQGLYGFVGYVLYSGGIQGEVGMLQGAVMLGAGLAMGCACLFSGINQGKVCASGIETYGSGHDVVGKTLILAAFPEFYAILSLVVAILMMSIAK